MKQILFTNTNALKVLTEQLCVKKVPFLKRPKAFTNAAGQDAPTSISRGRNARFSGVFSLYNIILRQNI